MSVHSQCNIIRLTTKDKLYTEEVGSMRKMQSFYIGRDQTYRRYFLRQCVLLGTEDGSQNEKLSRFLVVSDYSDILKNGDSPSMSPARL